MASDYPPPTEDYGLKIRMLNSKIEVAQHQLNELTQLLRGYREETIYGYDAAGNPVGFHALCQRSGNWLPSLEESDPFAVTLGGTLSAPTAKVALLSSLLKSIVLNDLQTITGLDTDFTFIPGNDLIWLEITISSGAVTAATINSYGLGGLWAPSDLPNNSGTGQGPFEYDLTTDANGNNIFDQTIARLAIFSSVTSTTSPFPIVNTQLLKTNLLMEGDVYNGDTDSDGPAVIGIIMPRPFSGPYIAT